MNYGIVLQWAAIIFTLIILVRVIRGKSTNEKKAGVSFLVMLLILNIGYLFELMAEDCSAVFFALQIEYAAFLFMGYFICLFFIYYAKRQVPQWMGIYTFVFDVILLVITWTSNRHTLVFKNVACDFVNGSCRLSYERGELYPLIIVGCELIPLAFALVMVLTYIGNEWIARLRKQTMQAVVLLFLSFGCAMVFILHTRRFSYDIFAPLAMLIVDFFAVRFWGQEGFHPQTASMVVAFDSLHEGVIVLDGTLKLKSYNQAAKQVFPELEPTLIDHHIKVLRTVPQELVEEYEKKEIEVGSRRYVVERLEVKDSFQSIRGYVLIFTDRTMECSYIAEIERGRKLTEQAKQEALSATSELKQANHIKADFLSHVSHEIRTPMNAIVGLSELIIEESRGRKVYDFACDIKNASTNLLAIIDDIVSLSKLDSGQFALEQEEYSTEQLLEETMHLAKIEASSKGLQLKREISPKLPSVLVGDTLRIRQMIGNFLDFGMKHTERGYVKMSVTHKWINEKQVLMVYQFEDTGAGLTKEETEKLFDQYRLMDEESKEHSLERIGLGIVITKRFVDLMNGTVEVTSEPGKGTVFTVCFPQEVVDIRSIEQHPWRKLDVPEARDGAFVVPDYRVLLVDDNKINLKVAGGAMAAYQFRVDEAKSGQQAIDLVKANTYDMIFMDHMMPEMDGIEATDHIRHTCGENGKTPIIIALSANAYNNARDMFLHNGFQDFIAKPLDKNELHQLLCKWIPENRRLSAEELPETTEKVFRTDKAELFMSGVDLDAALEIHSGGLDSYLELLELFYMDGEEKKALVEKLLYEEDFKNYEIEVHGLKSAAANIGAKEFSELAKKHEFAAKEGDYEWIRQGVPELLSEYNFLLHEIARVLKTKGYLKEEEETEEQAETLPEEETHRRMAEILSDIENFRPKPAAEKVKDLLSENVEKTAKDCLKDVQNRLKMYRDEDAEDLLRAFLNN